MGHQGRGWMKHLISGSSRLFIPADSMSLPASWLEEAKEVSLLISYPSVVLGTRADRRLADDVITSKLNISIWKPTKRWRLPWFTCVTQNHHDLGLLRPCCPMRTHSPTCREHPHACTPLHRRSVSRSCVVTGPHHA